MGRRHILALPEGEVIPVTSLIVTAPQLLGSCGAVCAEIMPGKFGVFNFYFLTSAVLTFLEARTT